MFLEFLILFISTVVLLHATGILELVFSDEGRIPTPKLSVSTVESTNGPLRIERQITPSKQLLDSPVNTSNHSSSNSTPRSPSTPHSPEVILTGDQDEAEDFTIIKEDAMESSEEDEETEPMVTEEEKRKIAFDSKKKMDEKRVKILQEILDTEKTYVKGLYVLNTHFMQPLQPTGKRAGVVDRKIVEGMFAEIETIIGINEKFLQSLRSILEPSATASTIFTKFGGIRVMFSTPQEEQLADMILQFAQSFKLYTGYVSKYHNALKLISKEKEKNEKFRDFLESVGNQLRKEKFSVHTINDFLITPIQRLPRYVLLLQDLLRNTPTDSKMYQKLNKALDLVKEVTEYVNKKQEEFGSASKMIELSQKLRIKNLISPARHFVKEGNAQFCGAFSQNANSFAAKVTDVTLYLFNDIVVVVEEKHKKKKWSILLYKQEGTEKKMNATISDIPRGFSISSQMDKTVYRFQCATNEEKNAWKESLEFCIQN